MTPSTFSVSTPINKGKSMTAVELVSHVQRRFKERSHLFADGDAISTLDLKELGTIRNVIHFSDRHIKNKTFLGLSYAHLSNMLRYNKGQYATLSKQDREVLKEVLIAGTNAYSHYANDPATFFGDLPAKLSKSRLPLLLNGLDKATKENNNFVIGFFAGLLLIKASGQ